jgi:putative transcriptional regulator
MKIQRLLVTLTAINFMLLEKQGRARAGDQAVIQSVCLLLLLAFTLPTFGDDAPPTKSIFLVARKNLPGPFFHDSVVLVTNHHGSAPVGVIVNRPTEISLASVFPDIERLRSREEKLFFGGPVGREELVVVFRAAAPPPDAIEVLDGVYMSSSRELLRELLGRESPVDGLRVFAGHAGWAPEQLESEVARGDWHLTRADATTVFEKKPGTLWQELERRASAIVALRSTH